MDSFDNNNSIVFYDSYDQYDRSFSARVAKLVDAPL